MATTTENFGLTMPDDEEFYDVQVSNTNMQIIDQALKNAGNNPQLEADVTEIKNEIGSTTDTGGSSTAGTVMAKGNAILTEVNKIGNMNDTGATATTGTVFGKLNSLILKEQKYLSRKRVISGVTSGQSNTVIDVSGSGLFFLMHKTMGNDINASIEFDGTVVNGTFQSNHCGVAVSGSNYRIYNTSIPTSTVGDYYSSFSVIQFKSNLKITCTPVTNDNITVFYALYE